MPHIPSVTPKLFLKNVAWMRKLETSQNTAGEVSTFAGQCESPGEHDGDSSEAQFSTAIQGVACLSNCSVLVTDPSSRSVRIIDVGEHCPQPAGRPQTPSGEQCPEQDPQQTSQCGQASKPFLQGFLLQIFHRLCCSLLSLVHRTRSCLLNTCARIQFYLHAAPRWHVAVWSLGCLAAAVAASSAGSLLLRTALDRRIRNKRAQVEEASAAGQTRPVLRHLSKVILYFRSVMLTCSENKSRYSR